MSRRFSREFLAENNFGGIVFARFVLSSTPQQKETDMKLKITLAALALSLSPAIASAMCSSMKPAQTASMCAEGQVWDAATAACIEPVSS
jgi:hypothetical protein